MIRTRLVLVFSLLVALTLAQLGFSWWATRAAAEKLESITVAAALLTNYLDLGANKQRLKVWFAQSMLTGDSNRADRDVLIERMQSTFRALNQTIERWQVSADPKSAEENNALERERATVDVLTKNFVALVRVLDETPPLAIDTEKAKAWRNAIEVFDRSEGSDMRVLLADAVARQRNANEVLTGALDDQIKTLRNASLLISILISALGLLAMIYFVAKIQQPMARIFRRTNAIADGDYAAASPASSSDEFGGIERALEAMRSRLAQARERDLSIQAGLERIVAERTRELTQSYESLMDQDARRRQFFADIGHELRTPITVIRGEAEVALRGGEKAATEYRASLSRIVDASDSLTQRSNELIQLAKADAGDRTFEYAVRQIRPIVQQAVDQALGLALPREIALIYREEASFANVHVRCDQPRLSQVLMIVIENAIRYSPLASKIVVTGRVVGDRALIEIADEGIGFSAEEKSRVFERYFRGERARELRADGMGLGLAMAHAIMTAHGGSIRIDSNVPTGALVTVEIPCHAPADC